MSDLFYELTGIIIACPVIIEKPLWLSAKHLMYCIFHCSLSTEPGVPAAHSPSAAEEESGLPRLGDRPPLHPPALLLPRPGAAPTRGITPEARSELEENGSMNNAV